LTSNTTKAIKTSQDSTNPKPKTRPKHLNQKKEFDSNTKPKQKEEKSTPN